MSRHEGLVRMRHMLSYSREAISLARGKKRADLDSDQVLGHAMVRLIEIVGEAASRVPREVQSQHPAVPWAEIVGLRNRLIHGYYTVDLDIAWKIVVQDLPALVAELERIVPPEEKA